MRVKLSSSKGPIWGEPYGGGILITGRYSRWNFFTGRDPTK